jgi:hypothetical protein
MSTSYGYQSGSIFETGGGIMLEGLLVGGLSYVAAVLIALLLVIAVAVVFWRMDLAEHDNDRYE